jgi:cytochrome c oxidase subunit 4
MLLGITVTLAYQPLGRFNGPIALTIATIKTLIVAAIFMELRDRRPLTLAFAGAGLFWLAVLLWLASADFTRRPGFPPTLISHAGEHLDAGMPSSEALPGAPRP